MVVNFRYGLNLAKTSLVLTIVCLLATAFAGVGKAHAYQLKKTKTGNRVRWSSPVITLYVDEHLEEYFGKDVVRDSLTIATDAWRGLHNVPDVLIADKPASGYQTNTRTNGVYLMKPWPFAKEQLAVTVSTYDLDGRMIGADILVNGESDYAFLPDGDDITGMTHHDIAAVLTHEMGHVLGLDESPDDQSATMWPYIRGGEVHQRTLTDDDEQGIVAAYKDMAFDAAAANAGCTQASVLGARPDSSAVEWSAVLLAATWVGRRSVARRGVRRAPPRRHGVHSA